jgi:hypothetical protein
MCSRRNRIRNPKVVENIGDQRSCPKTVVKNIEFKDYIFYK